jgi:hypothetical protein
LHEVGDFEFDLILCSFKKDPIQCEGHQEVHLRWLK